MSQFRKQKILVATLFGLFSVTAISNWYFGSQTTQEEVSFIEDISGANDESNSDSSDEVSNEPKEYADISSSGSKQTRTTELGKIEPSKSALKKEVEVILADPKMSEHWGIKKTSSHKAWNITMGNREIIVAIIDTGIDSGHKDLQNNLWVNKGEVG